MPAALSGRLGPAGTSFSRVRAARLSARDTTCAMSAFIYLFLGEMLSFFPSGSKFGCLFFDSGDFTRRCACERISIMGCVRWILEEAQDVRQR